jgi:hypothetical protein
MTGTIGEAPDGFVAAKGKINRAGAADRIAERPAASILSQFKQRTAMRALDGHCSRVSGDKRRFNRDQSQHLPVGRQPRALAALRAGARQRRRGPPRRQTEAMNFADDSIARDADLGGDLTAGQACVDIISELIDTLRRPSFQGHRTASSMRRPDLHRGQGKGSRSPDGIHAKRLPARRFSVRLPCGRRFKPVERKKPRRAQGRTIRVACQEF